jgi:hypothetical protein
MVVLRALRANYDRCAGGGLDTAHQSVHPADADVPAVTRLQSIPLVEVDYLAPEALSALGPIFEMAQACHFGDVRGADRVISRSFLLLI